MRGLSEHAARRAASVQRSSATSVRTVSEDLARRVSVTTHCAGSCSVRMDHQSAVHTATHARTHHHPT